MIWHFFVELPACVIGAGTKPSQSIIIRWTEVVIKQMLTFIAYEKRSNVHLPYCLHFHASNLLGWSCGFCCCNANRLSGHMLFFRSIPAHSHYLPIQHNTVTNIIFSSRSHSPPPHSSIRRHCVLVVTITSCHMRPKHNDCSYLVLGVYITILER